MNAEHAATLDELRDEFRGLLSLPVDEDVPDLLARGVQSERLAFAQHSSALGCPVCAEILVQIEAASGDDRFDRLHRRLADHLFVEDDEHIDRLLSEEGPA